MIFILKRILIISALFFAAVSWARAEPSATKPIFEVGDKVKVASCKIRAGKDWASTGYPNAELRPIFGCGERGVVVELKRSCAPSHLKIDSCDPWSYEVHIAKLNLTKRFYPYQIGKGSVKDRPRNRMVDFWCDDKKEECKPNTGGKK